VLASAPVNSGTATMVIGQFHMPLSAYIKIYDSLGNQLASTSSPVNIFGGDVYTVANSTSGIPSVPSLPNATIPSVPSLPNPTIPSVPSSPSGEATFHLTVNMQSDHGTTLTGYFIQLKQNGITVESGSSLQTFTLISNQQYTIKVNDYGNYAFDHWLDTGSTSSDRNISVSSDTSIVAVYRLVH